MSAPSACQRECCSCLEAEAWLPHRRGSNRRYPQPATEEVAVSESTQDRPDEADENAPKPGEQDTETVAGVPKKAPESKDGEQSKQDE
jgi:hypothetical protein